MVVHKMAHGAGSTVFVNDPAKGLVDPGRPIGPRDLRLSARESRVLEQVVEKERCELEQLGVNVSSHRRRSGASSALQDLRGSMGTTSYAREATRRARPRERDAAIEVRGP
jgi:hypothetical protein